MPVCSLWKMSHTSDSESWCSPSHSRHSFVVRARKVFMVFALVPPMLAAQRHRHQPRRDSRSGRRRLPAVWGGVSETQGTVATDRTPGRHHPQDSIEETQHGPCRQQRRRASVASAMNSATPYWVGSVVLMAFLT